ncbi:MAG: hypothetical protein SPI72_03730 [Porphyromonas sp.]|nr:hypothetical protein [Porphyromonas sp.]
MEQSKEVSFIKDLFRQITERMEGEHSASVLHDLFIQIDSSRGELQIYGDEDHLLASKVIFSWIHEDTSEPKPQSLAQLRQAVAELQKECYFDGTLFDYPLSVQLVGEDFELIEELLFLDDDLVRLDDPLLQGYDKDLDEFIAKILAE